MKPFIQSTRELGAKTSHHAQVSLKQQTVHRSLHRPFSTIISATRPRTTRSPVASPVSRLQSNAIPRQWQTRFQNLRPIRHNTSGPSPNPTPHLGSPSGSPGLRDQLKRLFREYGWSAVGVYSILSLVDLPICFLIVRAVGTDRVGAAEHAILEWVREKWRAINPMSEAAPQAVAVIDDAEAATAREGLHVAAAAKEGDAMIWTQLAFAYAIHKSLFIFIRIPVTIAVTPKVVKTLRGWGWQIGKRPMRPDKAINRNSK